MCVCDTTTFLVLQYGVKVTISKEDEPLGTGTFGSRQVLCPYPPLSL